MANLMDLLSSGQFTPPSMPQGAVGPNTLGSGVNPTEEAIAAAMAGAGAAPMGNAIASSPRIDDYQKLEKMRAVFQQLGLPMPEWAYEGLPEQTQPTPEPLMDPAILQEMTRRQAVGGAFPGQ